MPSKGNGQRYQIAFTGFLAPELKKLHKQAKAAGFGKAYLDALETAVFRMQHDPWEFGELIGRLKHTPAKIHVGIIKPLVIHFAIHEEKPLVLIKPVQLLP